jgi:hypothetical protein
MLAKTLIFAIVGHLVETQNLQAYTTTEKPINT